MPRLVIRTGPLANREFTLNPGTNHVGRAERNEVCLDEDSISSCHCTIVVGDERVTIIDLNSTNGTFVNEAPVQSERLKPGDAVRLGDLECVFLGDARAVPVATIARVAARSSPIKVVAASSPPEPPRIAPPLPPPISGSGVPESGWCRIHPRSPAHYYCQKCQKAFCDLCVSVRNVGGTQSHRCRVCASECVTLLKRPEAPEDRVINFYTELPRAFEYPFRAEGMVLLTVGTLFYLIVESATYVSRFAGLIGLVSVIFLTVFGFGYLFAFMKSIITSTAQGSQVLPDWPDVSEWAEDIVLPFGQMLGTAVFSFLPVVGLWVAEALGIDVPVWLFIAAIVVSSFYYPMGLLSVAMHDTVIGLNPLLIVISISRVIREYLVCWLVLAGVFAVRQLTIAFLPKILPLPIVPYVISGFVGLYLLTVLTRILGLMYLAKKNELGWFTR